MVRIKNTCVFFARCYIVYPPLLVDVLSTQASAAAALWRLLRGNWEGMTWAETVHWATGQVATAAAGAHANRIHPLM
jgi:hypothetical protein